MGSKMITIESTSWQRIDVEMVSNHSKPIKIGKKNFSPESNCYVQKVELTLTGESKDRLYSILQHIHGDCDSEACRYCNIDDSGYPNCGKCKHYRLCVGPEDNGEMCILYACCPDDYPHEEYEGCAGFELEEKH